MIKRNRRFAHLLASLLQLLYKSMSVVRVEVASVDAFVARPDSVARDLLTQQLQGDISRSHTLQVATPPKHSSFLAP